MAERVDDTGRKAKGPLQGIRVLDIGQFIAGPVTCTFLAEFGADVIKIELPGQGDGTRYRHPMVGEHSVAWAMRGRNKRGITLDLRTEEGKKLFRRLVAESDVVVENFRSGTLERWGLGYDVLQKENPGIIVARISGFGQDGPYGNRSAFDRIGLAMAGLTYISGSPERPPLRPGVLVSDYSSAQFAVLGIMASLRRRAKTGQGGVVDMGIYEPILRMMGHVPAMYNRLGIVKDREGAIWPGFEFFCNAKAKDGRWVAVSAQSVRKAAPALRKLGLSVDEEAEQDLQAWIGGLAAEEAVARLREQGLACSIVMTVDDLVNDPHVAARENLVTLPDENLGNVQVQGAVPRMSATPGRIYKAAPGLGEHNRDVYGGLLGLSDDELERLASENVI